MHAVNQGEIAKPMLGSWNPLGWSNMTSKICYWAYSLTFVTAIFKYRTLLYLARLDSRWKYGKLAQLITGTASGLRQFKKKRIIFNHLLILYSLTVSYRFYCLTPDDFTR